MQVEEFKKEPSMSAFNMWCIVITIFGQRLFTCERDMEGKLL